MHQPNDVQLATTPVSKGVRTRAERKNEPRPLLGPRPLSQKQHLLLPRRPIRCTTRLAHRLHTFLSA